MSLWHESRYPAKKASRGRAGGTGYVLSGELPTSGPGGRSGAHSGFIRRTPTSSPSVGRTVGAVHQVDSNVRLAGGRDGGRKTHPGSSGRIPTLVSSVGGAAGAGKPVRVRVLGRKVYTGRVRGNNNQFHAMARLGDWVPCRNME